jgi:hypothetical protein
MVVVVAVVVTTAVVMTTAVVVLTVVVVVMLGMLVVVLVQPLQSQSLCRLQGCNRGKSSWMMLQQLGAHYPMTLGRCF